MPPPLVADPPHVILAGILGSFEQDLFFIVVALLLFGKRLPEVAGKMGRKMYQFRRGIDEMKSELSRPIRESIEAPIRDAADSARGAMSQARADMERAAAAARIDRSELERDPSAAAKVSDGAPNKTETNISPSGAPATGAFPYPNASKTRAAGDPPKS